MKITHVKKLFDECYNLYEYYAINGMTENDLIDMATKCVGIANKYSDVGFGFATDLVAAVYNELEGMCENDK